MYSESYEVEADTSPRLSLASTFVVLVIAFGALFFAVGSTKEADAPPQGETQRGWASCWNKAQKHKGADEIVWRYSRSECVRVSFPSSKDQGLSGTDYNFQRWP